MKKKILLAVSLLTVMALLSGCMSMMSGTSLEAMFGTGDSTTEHLFGGRLCRVVFREEDN